MNKKDRVEMLKGFSVHSIVILIESLAFDAGVHNDYTPEIIEQLKEAEYELIKRCGTRKNSKSSSGAPQYNGHDVMPETHNEQA